MQQAIENTVCYIIERYLSASGRYITSDDTLLRDYDDSYGDFNDYRNKIITELNTQELTLTKQPNSSPEQFGAIGNLWLVEAV